MADGSARRSRKAPGYLDERSVPFDAAVEGAIRSGDLAALLAIDSGVARELMATGRASLQVLAGALDGVQRSTEIRYSDDPFGVAYLVASLTAAR
jgi:aromatic ring-opening dioxygenase LigB subunit